MVSEDCAQLGPRPSISVGPPLLEPAVGTLGAALIRAAGGECGVTYVRPDGGSLRETYAELLTSASSVLGGLRGRGVAAGGHLVLQIADEQEFLTAFWACVLGGIVPVPVTPGWTVGERATADRTLTAVWRHLGEPPVLTGTSSDGTRHEP